MDGDLKSIKLGSKLSYPQGYDASLLDSIPRALSRSGLDFSEFSGCDLWTAYELSWLDGSGKPVVAIAEFSIPASSPNIVESKSFKYYLNSLNQACFESERAVAILLESDLSLVVGAPVSVSIFDLSSFAVYRSQAQELGQCIDGGRIVDSGRMVDGGHGVPHSLLGPSRAILQLESGGSDSLCDGVVYSHLLKSNCPVTGQPDWASIWVGCVGGRPLSCDSLLGYLVSYRMHQDFHENCVERIFSDLVLVADPEQLWVYARYTRRGGLDINPFRSLRPMAVPRLFGVRQ